MVDFYANPQFVRDLFNTIGDYSIAQVRKALEYDIDAVYFGDDWGQQRGLQMGAQLWREFIAPVLKRMYAVVRDAGATFLAPIYHELTGIICTGGTVRSHIGIVSREFQVPCVMGATFPDGEPANGDQVTIDNGVVRT